MTEQAIESQDITVEDVFRPRDNLGLRQQRHARRGCGLYRVTPFATPGQVPGRVPARQRTGLRLRPGKTLEALVRPCTLEARTVKTRANLG